MPALSHTLRVYEPSIAGVGDYVALLKPRVMSLVVFTALVGLVVAPGHIHPVIGFTALLCIAIGAGAAGALNMWLRRRHRRGDDTHRRPSDPAGPHHARRGARLRRLLAAFSVVTMGLMVNCWRARCSPSPSSFMPSSTRCGSSA